MAALPDYEKLGLFYLGRRHDLATRKTGPDLLLLESKNLVTHGLVVGMTGSGKTGLCLDLVEEAALDAVPVLAIDPKGDLANLLLTFPELRVEDFLPWINADDARRANLSVEEFAARQAEMWRKGLSAWGQDGARIRRLRDAADFAIYTPGSSAGLPLSMLRSFEAPPAEVLDDKELLGERIASTVSGLLQLLGMDADPVKGREAVLLANILQAAWGQGRNLDIGALIQEIQTPPVQRIGVMDVESFFPARQRFELSMQLNNLLASPKFAAWLEGEPLDVDRLLHTSAGKPRVAIFSIAHLQEPERMFFVTMLLNQVLGWMRGQSGTSSLRALLYMDEIFGYFPPVANPPSKLPLLTLLKQARAFGLGVVLATQNPVDLDYKGLANIGTWFIGRLQTDRDKARVLDGLEGAAAGKGGHFDRASMEQILAGLGSRVFLLHSVHEEAPELFESRWAMSYLRGPLSRAQIKALMDPLRGPGAAEQQPTTPASPVTDAPAATQNSRPVLPPEVPQFFVPLQKDLPKDCPLIYRPRLLGAAQVRYLSTKAQVDVQREVVVLTKITEDAIPVDWSTVADFPLRIDNLAKAPVPGEFAPCPPAAAQPKNYARWSRDFVNWIHGNRRLVLYKSPSSGLLSRPEEDERHFRIRLQEAAREKRDAAIEKLRQKYAPKIAALQERLRRAEATREREASQSRKAGMDAVISIGSTILGALFSKKKVSATTVSKASTAARGVGRTLQQTADVSRAASMVETLQQQLDQLDEQFRAEVDRLVSATDPTSEKLETLEIKPTKSNIHVRLVALVWLPFFRDAAGGLKPAF